jgi:pyrroline-5-carboxylate reductase
MKIALIGYGNMAEALGSRWAGKHEQSCSPGSSATG